MRFWVMLLFCVTAVVTTTPTGAPAASPQEDERRARLQKTFDEQYTDEIKAGHAAYSNKDYAEAIRIFLPLAIEGNLHAQFFMGDMYSSGWGVPEDHCFGFLWMEKAARQGHPVAAFIVTEKFLGTAVLPNAELAYRWALFTRFLGHDFADDLLFTTGNQLTDEQKTAIEQDMPNWDPARLPPTEYFFFDADALTSNEERRRIADRTGVSFCR